MGGQQVHDWMIKTGEFTCGHGRYRCNLTYDTALYNMSDAVVFNFISITMVTEVEEHD